MLTKADYQQAIRDSMAAYPTVAALYQVGDPRIVQHLDAMATMLAMYSAQVEMAQAEPFEKTRDATVLADAAMRGIVRKGVPARARVRAINSGAQSFQIVSGRTLLHASGLPYRIDTPATVPAGGTATFMATQVSGSTLTHLVSGSEPFYAIEVPTADDGSYLCSIAVSDDQGGYEYRDRYVNTLPEERVFHVEADDQQRIYVRLGFDSVVGIQPPDGTAITLSLTYTAGAIAPEPDSPFSFEYLGAPAESLVELRLDALVAPGENPMPMSVLRDLARYPSVYNSNAVFMGSFDFLVRRNFPNLQFLSVWNESAEEQARGPSLDNMNAQFVACLSSQGGELVLSEDNPNAPVMPQIVADADLTATQSAIKATILAADDSYRVRFVTPVRSKIHMTVQAWVSTAYVASDVREKIMEVLLAEFGATAAASRRGRLRPLYKRVYELLRKQVSALSDGESDMQLNITEPATLLVRPEMWRYLDASSLSVTVQTINTITPSWGG